MVSSALSAREVKLIPMNKEDIQHDYKVFEKGDATLVGQYTEGPGKENATIHTTHFRLYLSRKAGISNEVWEMTC